MDIRAVSVKQLNTYVRSLLEGDIHLRSVAVTGELSNFKNHYASGHIYFTLKDADAAIRCVMFRNYAAGIPFKPEDGKQVVLIGRVSVYEKDGQYQFYAEQMLPVGEGGLAAEFERIKEKLKSKGYFDAEHKRPIPKFPKRIAVVTSETGAAVQDILNILNRRFRLAEVVICPVSVQGASAVPEMLDALERLCRLRNIDLIIIGRGGGSAEDLNEFNSEALAEKLFSSPIPVISAVGHETDFSISDFVADMRAPTPSAAAELAVPDSVEMLTLIKSQGERLTALLTGKYKYSETRLNALSERGIFKNPISEITDKRAEALDKAEEKLLKLTEGRIENGERSVAALSLSLDALSPLKVLTRGFAVALKGDKTVKSAAELNINDDIRLKFSDGEIKCLVKETNINE